MADFWFGNLRKSGYFPAPNSGMDADTVGEDDVMSFANGGAYAAQSAGTHREFNLSWGVQEKAVMDFLKDYRNGVYGTGLLYMVDPFARNALPPHWANPGLTCEGWPSLVGPSVKPTRGPVNTITNLATNPSFEAASAPVVVRTNFARDPRATASSIPTNGLGFRIRYWGSGAGTTTSVTNAADGPIPSLTSYLRGTFTTAPANMAEVGFNHTVTAPSNQAQVVTNDFGIAPSSTFTWSVYVRKSGVSPYNMTMKLYYRNSSGVYISDATSPTIALEPDTWTRISFTHQTPAGAAYVGVATFSQGGIASVVVGDTFDATGLLVESGSSLGDYFDGSTPAITARSYGWTGAVNNSSSQAIAPTVAGALGQGALAYQDAEWSASGSVSVRVTPTTPTTGANWVYASSSAIPSLLAPGGTYTIMAKARLAAPLGNGSVRQILVTQNGTGFPTVQTSDAFPNEAGVHNIRHVVKINANATAGTIRLYNGTLAGGGDVWWDDLLIVEGEYKGPYFDGNTEFLDGTKGYWNGTPNASTSSIARTPGGMPNTGAMYTLTGEVGSVPQRKLTLPIPSDKDLWFGFSGVATNGGTLRMRGITKDGAYGPVRDVQLLDPVGSTRMNTKASGGQYSAIQVYMTTTLPGAATITLVSGKAVYSNAGETPTLTGDHIEGGGHTGFRIGDISTAYIQAADGHQYVTTATKGTEIEAWL